MAGMNTEQARKHERDAIVAMMTKLQTSISAEMATSQGNDFVGLAGAKSAVKWLILMTSQRDHLEGEAMIDTTINVG